MPSRTLDQILRPEAFTLELFRALIEEKCVTIRQSFQTFSPQALKRYDLFWSRTADNEQLCADSILSFAQANISISRDNEAIAGFDDPRLNIRGIIGPHHYNPQNCFEWEVVSGALCYWCYTEDGQWLRIEPVEGHRRGLGRTATVAIRSTDLPALTPDMRRAQNVWGGVVEHIERLRIRATERSVVAEKLSRAIREENGIIQSLIRLSHKT